MKTKQRLIFSVSSVGSVRKKMATQFQKML
jgi:hypothetical protein